MAPANPPSEAESARRLCVSARDPGFAEPLTKEGASVIVNGRTEPLCPVAPTSASAGPIRRPPAVDILVNNLGIFDTKAFEEIASVNGVPI